jgi:hypothetical protein
MRKLIVSCMCGERIQVPRSALGRTGLCPGCGRSLKITPDNAVPLADPQPDPGVKIAAPDTAEMDAKLTFGKAVDHYYAGEVAQALVLFTRLLAVHPDSDEIQRARTLCADTIRRAKPLPPKAHPLIEHKPAAVEEFDNLTSAAVRKFILDKMLHGETETAQLHAAELAGKMVGLIRDDRAENLQQAGNF